MMIIRGNSQLQSINKINNQSRKHTSTNNPIAPLPTKHLLFSTSKQQLNDRKKGPNSNFQFKETKLINYSSIPFLIHVANINTSSRSTSTSSPSPPPPPPPINDDAKYGKQQSKSGYKKDSAKDNMEKNKTEEIKEKGVKTTSQKEDTAQANKQNSQSGNEKSTVIDDQLFADKYSDENVRRVVEKATKGIKDTFIDTQETGGGNVKNQNEISSARGQEFDRSLDQNAKKVEKTDQKGEDMSRVADSQDRENDKTGKYTGTFKPGSQFDHRSDIDADLTRKAVDKTVQSITSNNHSNANQSSNQSADQSKKSQSDQSSNQSSNQSANQSTQSTQSTDQSKKNAKNDQNNNNNNSGNNAGGKRTNEASNMESKEYNRRSSENVRSDLNAKNDETNEYLNKTQDKVDQQKNEERQQKQQKMSDQDQKTIDQQIKENITKNMDQKRFEESQAKNQQTNKNINKNDNNNNINKFDNKNDINNDQMKRTKGNENNESKVNYVTDYMSNIANKAGKVINETIDHGIHPSELLNKVKETAENVKDKMGKVVQVVMENTSNKTTGKATENMDRKFSRMEPNMEEGIADDFAYKGNEKEIAKGDYDKNNFNYNNNDRFSYSKIMEKVKEKANLLQSEISSMGNVKMEGTAQENFHLKNGNEFTLKHPLWETWQVHEISAEYHRAAQTWKDKIAYLMVRALKFDFNLMSGFYFGERTPQKWLTHIIYLETIAGVPASAAALLRHISSLGRLRKDHGWIHSLIEEAENERVHLLTALELKKPNFWIRMGVMGLQISFFTVFTIYYLISPQFCHRWVGYMEEESIKSYTLCLEEMEKENTPMNKWGNEAAPELAKKYWHLDDNATIRDVFLMIRADEAYHRDVNHTFADMNSENVNPFRLH